MGWTICKPSSAFQEGLAPGEAALDRRGKLTLRADDAEKVALENFATILADIDGRRIAIRPPKPHEKLDSVALSATEGGKRLRVSVARALRLIGVTGDVVKGRYSVRVKEGMLMLLLDEARQVTPREAHKAVENA